ncbi:GIY-YIG nuclease family protein [Streptomyces sp. NPDC002668]|uniref:GIY-YIG nuclease family protein n=1 Tax=Streptomyces sp. NPDC002668 TaxID=3154422 RepID=UPI00331C0DD1
MSSSHPFDWAYQNHDGPWYVWPDLGMAFSQPCDGYLWAPSDGDPNYYVAIGYAPPAPPFTPEDPPQRTAVYRMFDAKDRLLYIGISSAPTKRWVQHSVDKEWWNEAARFTLDWRESRAEALHVEAEAIKGEKPIHNVVHNSANKAVA